jgi:hypothetical protein
MTEIMTTADQGDQCDTAITAINVAVYLAGIPETAGGSWHTL